MTDTPIETTVVTSEVLKDKLELERKFIGDLADALDKDTGRAAMLRRNAGNTIAEARGVKWFFGVLGARPINRHKDGTFYDEEAYFLIATLFASDKDAIADKNRFKGNFGATLLALKNNSGKLTSEQSPLDRRFNTLLDADFDPATGGELAFRLRQMTKRVIAEKDSSVRINWPQLLRDVKLWSNEKKWTQKSWARSYYAPNLGSQESSKTESSEE